MEEPRRSSSRDPGDDRQHFAGEAAHGGEQGGDQHDADDDEVEDENGMRVQALSASVGR